MKKVAADLVCSVLAFLLLLNMAACGMLENTEPSSTPSILTESSEASSEHLSNVTSDHGTTSTWEASSETSTNFVSQDTSSSEESNTSSEPPEKENDVTLKDFCHEIQYLRLQYDVYNFVSACIHADHEKARKYTLGDNVLPEQFPDYAKNPSDLDSYVYTDITFEPYESNGKPSQKANITVQYSFQGENSGVNLQMHFVKTGTDFHAPWNVIGCEFEIVSSEKLVRSVFELQNDAWEQPITLEQFCHDPQYLALQKTAFRFFNAYLNGDLKTGQNVAIDGLLDESFERVRGVLDAKNVIYENVGICMENGKTSSYAEFQYPNREDTRFYFVISFECMDDTANSLYKTWKVSRYDFEA